MRAFSVLRSLSSQYRIYLVDADIFCRDKKCGMDVELQAMCEAIFPIRLPLFRNLCARLLRFLRQHTPCLFSRIVRRPTDYLCAQLVNRKALGKALDGGYDKILVFRLYMYPIAELFIKREPNAPVYLDLDDIESVTRSRTADLRRRNGDFCESVSLATEAAFFERLEKDVLPGCQKVFVASASDKAKVRNKAAAKNLHVLPNVYALNTGICAPPDTSGFTFLFIGSYGYYPNHDAALVLCRNVIPRLNEISGTALSFRFVGAGASKGLQKIIQNTTGATFMGSVEDIVSAYSGVSAVVVPINAGGGTRVKILESFAFGKPVVSTHVGAEGLECEDGVHLLLASTTDLFVDCCLQLVRSKQLRASLTSAAAKLLQQKYRPGLLDNQILDV